LTSLWGIASLTSLWGIASLTSLWGIASLTSLWGIASLASLWGISSLAPLWGISSLTTLWGISSSSWPSSSSRESSSPGETSSSRKSNASSLGKSTSATKPSSKLAAAENHLSRGQLTHEVTRAAHGVERHRAGGEGAYSEVGASAQGSLAKLRPEAAEPKLSSLSVLSFIQLSSSSIRFRS